MGSLHDIRRRITSVKNTRQITRAMKLVAGAKLKRATDAAMAAKPYESTLARVLARVVQVAGDVEHPLLQVPENENDVLVVVLTSDRGLCGSFNSGLCRSTQHKIDAMVEQGKSVTLVTYGKKSKAYFAQRGYTTVDSTIELAPEDYSAAADALATRLSADMSANRFSQAFLAYNEYRSVMNQDPQLEQVLPMKIEAGQEEEGGGESEYLYEPSGEEILGQLLPMALKTRILQAFLETQAGEQAARMTAMDSATRNASEMIDDLTLQFNRARQAAITKELIEIVSGAEALNG